MLCLLVMHINRINVPDIEKLLKYKPLNCFIICNFMFSGIAWAIIPSNAQVISPYGDTWRLFIIVCAIPSLSSSLFFYCMPESPKFLMQKGRSQAAYETLKRIFRVNYPGKKFPVSLCLVLVIS